MTAEPSFWNRRGKGLLVALPGLIVPVAFLAACAWFFVQQAVWYFSLPLADRTADGDPFSADAGMFFAVAGIAVALLLCVPPLLVALPTRLRLWHCIVAMGLQLLALWVALEFALGGSGWARAAFILLIYVPGLMLFRLVQRFRTAPPPRRTAPGTP